MTGIGGWMRDGWTVFMGITAGSFVERLHPYDSMADHFPRWALVICAFLAAFSSYKRVRTLATKDESHDTIQ